MEDGAGVPLDTSRGILFALDDESIFSIKKTRRGDFIIKEKGRKLNKVTLSPEDFRQLIAEMTQLVGACWDVSAAARRKA